MSSGVYFVTKCSKGDGLSCISVDRLGWRKNTQSGKGVIMTRYANKSFDAFIKGDGQFIAGGNLKEAAKNFAVQQQGCCPENEIRCKFRTAYHERTLIPVMNSDSVVVGYRSLREHERYLAEERSRGKELRKIRQQKSRTPKPGSRRFKAPVTLSKSDLVLGQTDKFDEYRVPTWEPVLVGAS